MKKIWYGTDAYQMIRFAPNKWSKYPAILIKRWLWKYVLKYFITDHYVVHERLGEYLIQAGITKQYILQEIYINPDFYLMERTYPPVFYVFYYHPHRKDTLLGNNDKFYRWVYGIDLIEEARHRFAHEQLDYANPYLDYNVDNKTVFVRLDGSADMTKLMPDAGCMVRPSRHDGHRPRLIMEAEAMGIPTFYAGDYDFETTANEISHFISEERFKYFEHFKI